MTNLLKSFGKGCLYILVLPLLLVILSVYAVIGIVMFIYMGVKAAILFFTGRNFGELNEDIKARAILEGKQEEVVLTNVTMEEEKPEAPQNDFVSSYYMPLSSDIPAPKDENKEEEIETPKEGEEQ